MDLLRRLQPYSQGSGKYLLLIVVSIVATAVTEPLIPAMMKPLLDKGFGADRIALWIVPVALIGVFALRGLSSFLAKYATAALAYQMVQRLASAQFSSLHRAHPSLYTQQTASSLVNTMVYEVQTGATLMTGALLSLAKDILAVIALLGYLLYLNWQLTLIALSVGPAIAWVIRILSKRLHRLTKQSQTATDELAYVVEENVLAWRAVRLHATEKPQKLRFEDLAYQLRRLAVKSTVATAAMMPITQVLAAVALSAVICAALWQSASTGETVGGFVAFVTAMLMLIGPLRGLSETSGPLTRGMAALERGLDLMRDTPQETGGTFTPERSQPMTIELRDVCLYYPNAETAALDGLTLHIAAGRTIALVGSSGSGKTSLVNLLPRFVDATQGQVILGGVELKQWNLQALRHQFSFVSQDVVMFSTTIAANVALGEKPDDARVMQALQAAHLGDFVHSLPQGIHTQVGHNASILSGGQRQRLAIARAIYKNAPIVVLDEATSALDTESELAVKQALATLTAGRTTLIIAHRLSTIEHADEIVVMHQGRMVERGTHAQLLKSQSHYARLHQLGAT
ncbi:MAG: lipid A export permease/ATP-binding protein MsbA [Brachymonas sp.]|nr:lipid A export permease/ATP-binding protein MsbA [Brachymonas sp.]